MVGIYDAAGNVVAQYEYDAWGNILEAEGTLAAINPIRYRGYYYDEETKLYYLQSRYYNSDWCRFISADVYMDTGSGMLGTNMYAYCNNDPVNLVDPRGYAANPSAYAMNLKGISSFLNIATNGLLSASKISSMALNLAATAGVDYFANGFFRKKLGGTAENINLSAMEKAWGGLVSLGSANFTAGGKKYNMNFVMGNPHDVLAYASSLMQLENNIANTAIGVNAAVDVALWLFAPGLDWIGGMAASALTLGGMNELPIGTLLASSKTAYDFIAPLVSTFVTSGAEYLNGAAMGYLTANKQYSSGIIIFIPTALNRIAGNGSYSKIWGP